MTPTASQAYLALDILGIATSEGSTDPVVQQARATVLAALTNPGWTGKSETCSEYGRQPLMDVAEEATTRKILTD